METDSLGSSQEALRRSSSNRRRIFTLSESVVTASAMSRGDIHSISPSPWLSDSATGGTTKGGILCDITICVLRCSL
jgi:hypothetical protein